MILFWNVLLVYPGAWDRKFPCYYTHWKSISLWQSICNLEYLTRIFAWRASSFCNLRSGRKIIVQWPSSNPSDHLRPGIHCLSCWHEVILNSNCDIPWCRWLQKWSFQAAVDSMGVKVMKIWNMTVPLWQFHRHIYAKPTDSPFCGVIPCDCTHTCSPSWGAFSIAGEVAQHSNSESGLYRVFLSIVMIYLSDVMCDSWQVYLNDCLRRAID